MAALASSRSSRSALLGTAEDVLLCVDLGSEMGEPFGDTGSLNHQCHTICLELLR